jgi:hypothetical protein
VGFFALKELQLVVLEFYYLFELARCRFPGFVQVLVLKETENCQEDSTNKSNKSDEADQHKVVENIVVSVEL